MDNVTGVMIEAMVKEYADMSKEIIRNDTYDARIAAGVSNREKDGVIWKAFSKRGGFHDVLQNFCQAVRKPSVNAFEYDEDEGTYVICILLYNTIWMQLNADMDKLHESLSMAEQIKRDYVPAVHKRVYIREREVPENIVPASEHSGILSYLRAFDNWMMRFKLYAAIHDLIAGLCPSGNTTTVRHDRYEETEVVYDESELALLGYDMKYPQLLAAVSDVVEDMGKSLRPVRKEDGQQLENYKREAQRICSSIESNVFSKQEWRL